VAYFVRVKTYAEVLARNIRVARARADVTQAQAAERMQALGFSTWLRSTVSLIEQGKRRLMAEEALALALALETSLARLLKADRDDGYISLPGGIPVHPDSINMTAHDGDIGWDGDTPVPNPRRRVPAPDGGSQVGWHEWYEPTEPARLVGAHADRRCGLPQPDFCAAAVAVLLGRPPGFLRHFCVKRSLPLGHPLIPLRRVHYAQCTPAVVGGEIVPAVHVGGVKRGLALAFAHQLVPYFVSPDCTVPG
jgi:DNA-binding XRE family transcriptional regulator